MEVKVYDDEGDFLWSIERTGETMSGTACVKYSTEGTQQKVINVLNAAIEQAECELLVSDDADRVAHSS